MPEKQDKVQKIAGSPPVGEPEYLVIGFLRRSHGVHGEMLMDVHTDFPERIKPGKTFFVGELYQEMILSSCRSHHKGMLVRFRGITNPEEAGLYRLAAEYAEKSERPPDGRCVGPVHPRAAGNVVQPLTEPELTLQHHDRRF